MTFEHLSILTRRASLPPLASIELTAQVGPMKSNARKKHRKKGEVNKRCKQQSEEWGAVIAPECPGDPACEELLTCGTTALSRCDFGTFLDCLFGGPKEPTEAASMR